jgi:hypothetical protein
MENADYQNYSIRTLRKIAEVLDLELLVSLRDKKLPAEPVLKPQKKTLRGPTGRGCREVSF